MLITAYQQMRQKMNRMKVKIMKNVYHASNKNKKSK